MPDWLYCYLQDKMLELILVEWKLLIQNKSENVVLRVKYTYTMQALNNTIVNLRVSISGPYHLPVHRRVYLYLNLYLYYPYHSLSWSALKPI